MSFMLVCQFYDVRYLKTASKLYFIFVSHLLLISIRLRAWGPFKPLFKDFKDLRQVRLEHLVVTHIRLVQNVYPLV
jgi:hypothetical protein